MFNEKIIKNEEGNDALYELQKQKLENMGIQISNNFKEIPYPHLKELVEGVELVYKKHPEIKGHFNKIILKKMERGDITVVDKKRNKYVMFLNEKVWLSPYFRHYLKFLFCIGYFSTSTIKGNVCHELGHIVEGVINEKYFLKKDFIMHWNNCTVSKRMLSYYNFNEFEYKSISFYSRKNESEAFAEIFATCITGEINNKRFFSYISISIKEKSFLVYDSVDIIFKNPYNRII